MKTKTPQKTIFKIYIRSNYDRSKTIISKTIKNYHPRSYDLLLLIMWQKTEDEKPLSVYSCTLKVCLPRQLVSNFSCLSLKIVKLAFHWRWIFAWVARIYHNRFRSSSGQLLTQKCCFFFPFLARP